MIAGSDKVIDESRQGEALLVENKESGNGKKFYLESYGCAMNFADSEIVASILTKEGYESSKIAEEADLVLINTCSIRENAETRIRKRLAQFNVIKKKNPKFMIGILGCMAERLKSNLLEQEKLVDIVVGPDAYRELPGLIEEVTDGRKAVNVLLSREETYAEISPIRLNSNGVTAFVSIMRGCDNMCAFCVVPFTRGRERSRDPESIVREVEYLFQEGYKEITLLGQNVDSYRWNISKKEEIIDPEKETVNFAQLLEKVALVDSSVRIRFSTSHPKDMTDEVLYTMAKYENICKYIHLPVQSGSSTNLERMNRGYTREWYENRIDAIRRIMPTCAISTDIISGFCGETDEEHRDTITLMEEVQYEFAYMYKYSERPKTLAERKYTDDVPEALKQSRLEEVIKTQRTNSLVRNQASVGKTFEVLVEGFSKKSKEHLQGRNSQNAVVIFEKANHKKGDYVQVHVTECTSGTLIGQVV